MQFKPGKTTAALGATGLLLTLALASNHREAPITALDHKADIADMYAFVSYDANQVAGQPPEKPTQRKRPGAAVSATPGRATARWHKPSRE